MTLTKADLVHQLYITHPNLTKSQAVDSVETFLSLSKSLLIAGESLLLSGFGKFSIKDKRTRRGRNPQTVVPDLKDHSVAEIAQNFGISRPTVYEYLKK